MSTERLQEADGGAVADLHVKLQSDVEPPHGDLCKSLTQEVELLRQQVQQLCAAVRGLATLMSVRDKKVDGVLKVLEPTSR